MQATWTLPKARLWQEKKIVFGNKSDKSEVGAVTRERWVSHFPARVSKTNKQKKSLN